VKFNITFKSPDAVYAAVETTAADDYNERFDNGSLGEDEDVHTIKEDIEAFLSQFLVYGEMITVEFDTEAGTATVVRKTKH
jgi:hypothetical protein